MSGTLTWPSLAGAKTKFTGKREKDTLTITEEELEAAKPLVIPLPRYFQATGTDEVKFEIKGDFFQKLGEPALGSFKFATAAAKAPAPK